MICMRQDLRYTPLLCVTEARARIGLALTANTPRRVATASRPGDPDNTLNGGAKVDMATAAREDIPVSPVRLLTWTDAFSVGILDILPNTARTTRTTPMVVHNFSTEPDVAKRDNCP